VDLEIALGQPTTNTADYVTCNSEGQLLKSTNQSASTSPILASRVLKVFAAELTLNQYSMDIPLTLWLTLDRHWIHISFDSQSRVDYFSINAYESVDTQPIMTALTEYLL